MTPKGNILVTGGAGYIGSHTVLALRDSGWGPVVLDDLSTGSPGLLPDDVPLIEGDVADIDLVRQTLRDWKPQAVMHFAGSVVVPESIGDPLSYYRNNTCASRNLFEACMAERLWRVIFSSTAAVYGVPEELPVKEDSPLVPVNPYGASKWMTELMLQHIAEASELRYVALRYFNVAGADPLGRSGQISKAATHLIKVACEVATGKRQGMSIYGSDYDTPDGTCVRDYIHVADLAQAHVVALEDLMQNGQSLTMNCGYGHGFSVREVLAAVEQISQSPLNAAAAPRRPGDPPELVADSRCLRERLGWTPRFDDLRRIIETALAWERSLS